MLLVLLVGGEFLAAIALDMGRARLAHRTAVVTLRYRTAFLCDRQQLAVLYRSEGGRKCQPTTLLLRGGCYAEGGSGDAKSKGNAKRKKKKEKRGRGVKTVIQATGKKEKKPRLGPEGRTVVIATAYPVAANAGLAGHLDSVNDHLGREGSSRPTAVDWMDQKGYDVEGARDRVVSAGRGQSVWEECFIYRRTRQRLNDSTGPFRSSVRGHKQQALFGGGGGGRRRMGGGCIDR